MKRLYSKDLGIIFLLTAVYIILISFPNFSGKYIMDLVFFVLFFLFTGYSLIALIRPEEDYKYILRKPVLLLEFSVLLCLAVSVILRFSYLGLKIRSLVMVLSIIIMVMSISAYIRRINHFNAMKYEKESKTKGLDEVSQSIKKLTKTPVEALDDQIETPEPITDSEINPVEKPKNSEPDKLVVTEGSIRENFIKNVQEDEKLVETSKSKTGSTKMYLDLVIIDLLSVFVLITYFVKLQNIATITYFIGLLYMLFLVGYPLVRIFFAGKNRISKKFLIGISIGFSLPITSLIGTVVSITPYGFSVHNMLFPLAVLTLILSLIASKMVNSADS